MASMVKYLLDSSECYEGYNNLDECYCMGDYDSLQDDENIDNDTIEWSQSYWEDEKAHFNDFVLSEKKKYETRYKTEVLEIAMCGKVGRWNGSFTGGKIVDFDDILQMNVDSITIELDDDDSILIKGHHHDGTHLMKLYFLTESNMKKSKIWSSYNYGGANGFDYLDFGKIYDNLKPLKMSKSCKHFNYDYYKSV